MLTHTFCVHPFKCYHDHGSTFPFLFRFEVEVLNISYAKLPNGKTS